MLLTAEQEEIVNSSLDSFKINAVAGSGKTTTLLLYAQTHWTEDDIPKSLFVAPGQFVGEDGIYTAPENQLHNPSNIHP